MIIMQMRCAVQGFYFSWRIANDIRTGLADVVVQDPWGTKLVLLDASAAGNIIGNQAA